MDKTLEDREARKLNKRLRKYGLKLWNKEIDIKSNSPMIFTAMVSDLGKEDFFEIVVYPRALYSEDQGASHWNEPKYLNRIEKTK